MMKKKHRERQLQKSTPCAAARWEHCSGHNSCVSHNMISFTFFMHAHACMLYWLYTHTGCQHICHNCVQGLSNTSLAHLRQGNARSQAGIPRSGRGCRCPILSTTCSSVRECVELSWAMRFAQYPRIHTRQVNTARGQTLRASPNPFRIFDRGWVGCFVSECVCVCVL